jgi:hypothetical protein
MNAVNTARVLLDHRCQVDATDDSNSTALHRAVAFENLEMVSVLLNAGASLNSADRDGKIPIELAHEGTTSVAFAIVVTLNRCYEVRMEEIPSRIKKDIESFDEMKEKFRSDDRAISGMEGSLVEHPQQSGSIIVAIGDAQPESNTEVAAASSTGVTAESTSKKQLVVLSYASAGEQRSKHSLNEMKPAKTVEKLIPEDPSMFNAVMNRVVTDEDLIRAEKAHSRKFDSKFSKSLQKRGLKLSGSGDDIDVESNSANDNSGRGHHSHGLAMANRTNNAPVEEENGDETGILLPTAPKTTIAETIFPPAEQIPLLPGCSSGDAAGNSLCRYLDVIIAIEHCCDCATHSKQSLRHDETKYVTMANNALYTLIKTVVEGHYAVRVFAFRVPPTRKSRIG